MATTSNNKVAFLALIFIRSIVVVEIEHIGLFMDRLISCIQFIDLSLKVTFFVLVGGWITGLAA